MVSVLQLSCAAPSPLHCSLLTLPRGCRETMLWCLEQLPPRPATPSLVIILLLFTMEKSCVGPILKHAFLKAVGARRQGSAEPCAGHLGATRNRLCPAGAAPASPSRNSCGSSLPAPHHWHLQRSEGETPKPRFDTSHK